ncbi:MAG: hypothetical protein ACRDOU_25410 [Streptosporangiaceae bacterium]
MIASALAASMAWAVVPASAATGPVSAKPVNGTPELANTGTTQQVRQIAQCGDTMYAVGTFNTISQKGTNFTRNNVLSFSASKPYTMTSWNPNANGIVNSITFSPDCSTAYLGGKFSTVGGGSASNIAAVSTSTGALITGFGHSANGQVETLQYYNGHILTGGYYKSINNSSANPYMTSLNATTGKDDGFIHLSISGNYQFPGVGSNPTRVFNQQLSNSGTLEMVEGDFTSVGGQARQQVFMLNLSGSTATVTGWTSPELNTNCNYNEAFYAQAAAWSPDDSTIYVATTGYKPNGTPAGSGPRTGPCDAAIAYPSTQTSVTHTWINYPGCDSLYSTAADASTAYFGGHERWASNPDGCDFKGPGAIDAPGMMGLSPTTGALTFNPTRGRGLGADDMLVTSAGLWIASDNQNNTTQCGGVYQHAGICLLPYGA